MLIRHAPLVYANIGKLCFQERARFTSHIADIKVLQIRHLPERPQAYFGDGNTKIKGLQIGESFEMDEPVFRDRSIVNSQEFQIG